MARKVNGCEYAILALRGQPHPNTLRSIPTRALMFGSYPRNHDCQHVDSWSTGIGMGRTRRPRPGPHDTKRPASPRALHGCPVAISVGLRAPTRRRCSGAVGRIERLFACCRRGPGIRYPLASPSEASPVRGAGPMVDSRMGGENPLSPTSNVRGPRPIHAVPGLCLSR